MRKIAIAQFAILATFSLLASSHAMATEDWCAVSKMTPNGFVALRAGGPGADFPQPGRLLPYEFLWMSTASCMKGLCDKNGRWLDIPQMKCFLGIRVPPGHVDNADRR